PVPRVGDAGGGIDERCLAVFPGTTEALVESDLDGRPSAWPPVPEWAVLCGAERESDTSQVAWYATDPGISRAEVFRTYERALAAVGQTGRAQTGRAQTAEGEILTGVVAPEHSFWMETGRDLFRVTWAVDGEYAD
ncbi:MAG: hypothetical protein WA971_10355, partial [Microbacterium sp.]